MTSRRLKEFDEVQRARGALAARQLGVIAVPLNEIVGSVGRARYFPEGLRSGRGLTPSRVRRLVAALDRGEVLPAVMLYRIGHEYYIADGHHRIAAARLAGAEYVDADVTVYLPETDRPEDVVARERILFEQRTGLTMIVLHEVGQYPKLARWIEDYAGRRGRGSLRGAAQEWYARVYLPTMQDPQFERLLRRFPGRSPGDLFVYLGDHKWILSKAAGFDVGVPAALDDFERHLQRSGSGAFVRWLERLVEMFPRVAGSPIRSVRRRTSPPR